MFLYMGILISWLQAGFSLIWKCNPYHKSTKMRKDSEYRKTSTLNEIPLTKSCSPKLEKSSNEKKEFNYKMALHRFSPFPLLEGLTPKKNANLIEAQPPENCNSVDILKVFTSNMNWWIAHFLFSLNSIVKFYHLIENMKLKPLFLVIYRYLSYGHPMAQNRKGHAFIQSKWSIAIFV